MNELGNIKLIINILLLVIIIVLWFLAYKIGWKYMIQEKSCDSKTIGKVIGYSKTTYGNGYIRLPIVKYQVSNKNFTIVGPEYKLYLVMKKQSIRRKESEVTYTTDPYQQTFHYQIKSGLFGTRLKNPMINLFPIGMDIEVFYSSNNPELAYVLRYANLKWVFYLLFGIGCLLLIVIVTLQVVI